MLCLLYPANKLYLFEIKTVAMQHAEQLKNSSHLVYKISLLSSIVVWKLKLLHKFAFQYCCVEGKARTAAVCFFCLHLGQRREEVSTNTCLCCGA